RAHSLKPRHHSNLPLGEAAANLCHVDPLDARLAVYPVRANRELPAEPGTRVDPEILQGERQQAGRDLLPRSNDDIVVARVMEAAHLARPIDQLVGGPRHRGNDDRYFIATVDLALDALRDVLDPRDSGDRGTAEFLNNARHAPLRPVRQRCRRDGPAPLLPGRGAITYPFRLSNNSASHSAKGSKVRATSATVDPQEIARFAEQAEAWWDPEGSFRPLHRLNPTRLRFIRQPLTAHFDRSNSSLRPFDGLTLLDIGCGGGLVAEPMARLGFVATAVDADAHAIAVARSHAEATGLAIDYRIATAESMAGTGPRFDVAL